MSGIGEATHRLRASTGIFLLGGPEFVRAILHAGFRVRPTAVSPATTRLLAERGLLRDGISTRNS